MIIRVKMEHIKMFCLIGILLLLCGCTNQQTDAGSSAGVNSDSEGDGSEGESEVESEDGAEGEDGDSTVKIDESEGELTIKSDEGEIKISGMDSDDWCPAGGSWSYAGAGQAMQMKIIGKEQYKGMEMCHAKFEGAGTDGSASIDYYFSEDEETLYMISNGQEIEISGMG